MRAIAVATSLTVLKTSNNRFKINSNTHNNNYNNTKNNNSIMINNNKNTYTTTTTIIITPRTRTTTATIDIPNSKVVVESEKGRLRVKSVWNCLSRKATTPSKAIMKQMLDKMAFTVKKNHPDHNWMQLFVFHKHSTIIAKFYLFSYFWSM